MPFFNIPEIKKKLPDKYRKKPFIIAVDGGSGSGKSTLAKEWKRFDPAVSVITLDDFHIPVDDLVLDKRSPRDNFESAFDIKYITRKVLKPLHEGRVASYKVLNLKAGNYGEKCTVRPSGIILIEGVYSHRPVWSDHIDFKIWLDTGAGKRLRRMKNRKANTVSQMKCWQRTEKWYMKKYKLSGSADMVIQVT